MSSLPVPTRTPAGLARLGSRAEAALDRARLHVVPRVPQLRSRAPRVPFVTLVSVLLLGGVIGLLLFNTSMQQASFEATRLQQQADTLDAQQQALQSDIDRLDDPQQIAARATRLGMVVPRTSDYLHLPTGRISGHAPVATVADRLPIKAPPVAVTPVRTAPSTTSPASGTDASTVPSDPVHLGAAPSTKSSTTTGTKSSTTTGTKPGTKGSAKTGTKTGAPTTNRRAGADSGSRSAPTHQTHQTQPTQPTRQPHRHPRG